MGFLRLVRQADVPAHPTECYNVRTQKGNATLGKAASSFQRFGVAFAVKTCGGD